MISGQLLWERHPILGMKGRLPPKAATIRCVMQGQEALPGDRTPVLQKDYFAQQPDEILIFSFSSLVHKSRSD